MKDEREGSKDSLKIRIKKGKRGGGGVERQVKVEMKGGDKIRRFLIDHDEFRKRRSILHNTQQGECGTTTL